MNGLRSWAMMLTTMIVMAIIIKEVSSSYMCSRRWRKVLEHDAAGTPISGSKIALKIAATEGASIRVFIHNTQDYGLLANDDLVSFLFYDDICIESLQHIAKLDWNKFHNQSIWQFMHICSTGDMQTLNWKFGQQTSLGETHNHVHASWYVQYSGCKDGEGNALVTTLRNGTALEGSIETLVLAVREGVDITAFDSYQNRRLPMKTVSWTPGLDKITGQNQWSLAEHWVGDQITINSWPAWRFTLWSTDGSSQTASWDLKTNNISTYNTSSPIRWYGDPCWQLAYSHDSSGNVIDGSLAFLQSAVFKGHRVKIIMNNVSMEVDEILYDNGGITAILSGDVSRNFETEIFWLFRIVSTTGDVKLYPFNVLNPTTHGFYRTTESVAWFVDERPWKNILSTDEQGATIRGSKQDLVAAVKNGADLRFSWTSASSDWTTIQKSDSITVHGTEIAVENLQSLGVEKDPQEGFIFPHHPYWLFSLSTTQGEVDFSQWSIGTYENRGHYHTNMEMDWFVNE